MKHSISSAEFRHHTLAVIAENGDRGHPADTGLAISVIKDSECLYEDTFGFRDRQQKLPVTAQTIFGGGSLTKAITASAFVLAEERGLVVLDAPINRKTQLIELKDRVLNSAFSIRDILCHRVGLPANDLLWLLSSMDQTGLASRLRHLDLIPNSFRTSFVYSNLLYSVLSLPFEATVGKTLDDFIASNLFNPLGMTSATLEMENAMTAVDLALPSGGNGLRGWQDTNRIRAAGGLYLSLSDAIKWLRLHSGTARAVPLFSSRSINSMHTAQISVPFPDPLILQGLEWLDNRLAYGLGWFIARYHGHKIIFHPGFTDGFSSVLAAVPDLGLGVVILTNGHLNPVPGLIIQRIFQKLLSSTIRIDQQTFSTPTGPRSCELNNGTANSLRHLGKYHDPGYGLIQITQTEGVPLLKYERQVWPLHFADSETANFTVEAFGLQLPMTIRFESRLGETKDALIPFSIDPRVAARTFSRID